MSGIRITSKTVDGNRAMRQALVEIKGFKKKVFEQFYDLRVMEGDPLVIEVIDKKGYGVHFTQLMREEITRSFRMSGVQEIVDYEVTDL